MTADIRRPLGKRRGGAGPISDVTRAITPQCRLWLWVRAGGWCEFDGCANYLLEHPITLREGNYGEAAHIVAFRPGGARGKDAPRPKNINAVENLMLLCGVCHKEVDDHPERYTRETLRQYKDTHESWIRHVTGLRKDRKTAVFVFTAPIGGQTVTVPFDHMVEATAPRYPTSRHPDSVDLASLVDGKAFLAAARAAIREATRRFLAPNGEGTRTRHVSVFALAPIPLLVFLGRELSNKVPSDIYQRHRDTETWVWKSGTRPVRYAVRRLRKGTGRGRVALVLSLSGSIRIRDLPKEIRGSATVYEITLAGQVPRPTFLRTREDLEAFRTAYQEALGLIVRNRGLLRTIELFPAVPAPIAVLCGRELLPKVHPALRVWDYDKSKGGFTFKLEVN